MNAKKIFKSTTAMVMASLVITAGTAAAATIAVEAGNVTASAISVHEFSIQTFNAYNPYGGQMKTTSPVEFYIDFSNVEKGPYNCFTSGSIRVYKDGVDYASIAVTPSQSKYRFNPSEAGTYTAELNIVDYYGNYCNRKIDFYVANRDDVNIKNFKAVSVYSNKFSVGNTIRFDYAVENAHKNYGHYTCAYIEVMKDGVQHAYINLDCDNPNTKWNPVEHGYYTAKITIIDYYGKGDVRTIGFNVDGRASDAHIDYLNLNTPTGKLTAEAPISFDYGVSNAYTNYGRYTCAEIQVRQGGKTSKDGTLVTTIDVNVDKDKSTWKWTPSKPGRYILVFNFTDGYRHYDVKSIAVEIGEPLRATASVSRTNMDVGQSVTIKGGSTNGAGAKKYAYYYKKSGEASWKTIKSFSTSTSVSFKPTSAGTYQFLVRVQDGNGANASTYKNVTVNSALVNNSKLSATTVKVNQSFTVTGAASGGSGSYQYAMYYKLSTASSYTTARGFSTTKTATLKFSKAGKYTVKIAVKDSNGMVVYKYITVTVK